MQNQRVVLITGANRGLGLKLAEVLADKYQLILTARQLNTIEEIKETMVKKYPNPKILTHQLDISDRNSILQLKQWLIKENIKLDVLVNNAGISKAQNPFEIIDINLGGTIDISEQLLPTLTSDGKIILVSSMMGKLSCQSDALKKQLSSPKTKDEILQLGKEFQQQNNQGGSYYSASKALLNAYGRYVLSGLVSPNQSVYCMHPGWIKTDMGGPNAPGTLDDGIVTSRFLIDYLPFQRDENYHGKYFNEYAKVEDF